MAKKRLRPGELLLHFFILVCSIFSVVLLVTIIVFVFVKGLHVVNWEFLTTVTSARKGTVGIAGNIVNTLIVIILTLLIVTPLGIGAAIYLNEYAKPGKLVNTIEFMTEVLSGIPSIIFGLFGMMFFGQTLGLGYSLLTGSLTLILMVFPLVTRNTQEALKTVPDGYRQGSIALGAGKWYMIRTILIPSAMPGIITGVILAIGRIVGESAALIFTAGSAKYLPKNFLDIFRKILDSGGTLTVKLYLSATSEGDFDTAFGTAVVLIIIVLIINILTKVLTRKFDPSRQGR
ncbi:MAG: phosphate ABC transporter permease PstA [Lachnospiraceae bacterium]|nr:phosphate ABC transporter permease PstA [Lachnospiraceae bacterium]